MIKLTEEILDALIMEVLQEKQEEVRLNETDEKAHCKGLPTLEKMKCFKADDESRERSKERTKKKKNTFPGYYDGLHQLGYGVISEEEEESNLAEKIKKHLYPHLNTTEMKQLHNAIKKDSIEKRLAFCSAVKDSADGSYNDFQLKKASEEAKLKLKQQAQKHKQRTK